MSDYEHGSAEVFYKEESKYGFKDMDGNYWNFGAKADKSVFKAGKRYKVDWYQKAGAKYKYITEGKEVVAGAPVASVTAPAPEKPKPVTGKPALKVDDKPTQSRDTSIERQAILKSVLESPVLAKLSDSVEDAKALGTELFRHFFKELKGE